jgi:four helix bundle protein
MDDFDIPIFKKTYDLYKTFYGYRNLIPKQDRYTICERCDTLILDVLQNILVASKLQKGEKLSALEAASAKLNFLRVFIRLMKETKAIDNKKYLALQSAIDEIGRMLGGWIRSVK